MGQLIVVMFLSSGFILAGNLQSYASTEAQATVQSPVSAVQAAVTTDPKVQAAQQAAQQKAAAMILKAKTLVAQAKQYLDQGKFNDAISTAQNVLNFDPKNMDAQKIIVTAKEKLKALATQKAGELKTGLMNKLGTFGK